MPLKQHLRYELALNRITLEKITYRSVLYISPLSEYPWQRRRRRPSRHLSPSSSLQSRAVRRSTNVQGTTRSPPQDPSQPRYIRTRTPTGASATKATRDLATIQWSAYQSVSTAGPPAAGPGEKEATVAMPGANEPIKATELRLRQTVHRRGISCSCDIC